MNGATKRGRLIRFSVFEVDLDSGELFRQGRKVKLQGQPFELLLALLERPGEVVTREELQQKVWPADTVVDFDRGLNRAINKVREALGDSAETPRFIETLPRRGYRFIGSLQEVNATHAEPSPAQPMPVQAAAQPKVGAAEKARPRGRRNAWLLGIAIGLAVILIVLVTWMALRLPIGGQAVRVEQLTTNSAENPIWNATISPDGKYLAYGDLAGIQIRVITTGETHVLPRPKGLSSGDAWFPAAWFPDGTRILANSVQAGARGPLIAGWTVSVIGGTATRLRDDAFVESISPDESLIAFTTGSRRMSLQHPAGRSSTPNSEIWVMGTRGEDARMVLTGDALTYFGCVRWSPDGKRIAYRKLHLATESFAEYTIESRAVSGGVASLIVETRRSYFMAGLSSDVNVAHDFCWTPDGRIIYALPDPAPSRDVNLWEIAVDSKTGKPSGRPRRITNLAGFRVENPSLTGDGRRLVFESGSDQSHVYVARVLSGGMLETPRRLTLDERYNTPFAWTPDGKVIFSSDRSGRFALYKQALHEQVPELIPTGPASTRMARVSPGGVWLIYAVLSNLEFPDQSDSVRLMREPLSGGAPQLLFESKSTELNFDCPYRTGAPCLVSERRSDTKRVTLESFDPVDGARRELFSVDIRGEKPLNWTISPDGSQIAITGTDPQGGIEVRSLQGKVERTIEIQGWPNPLAVDWSADGRSLWVSHFGLMASPSGPVGATLLHVDLQGRAQALWETRGGRYTWGIASPDGRYLAIRGAASERNAWMIENF